MSIQSTDNYRAGLSYVATEKATEINRKTEKSTQSSTAKAESSEATLSLTSLADDLDATSDVDWDKVNEVKNALANGDLNIDLDSLSQAIMEMHRS